MLVQSSQRLLFLDNLRYLIVLFVMLFHVSAGYSGWPEYYHETQAGGFFAIMHGIITSIRRMPLLFFIAGYFAMPSLVGRGGVSFCKHKVIRLGVPWVLCIFLVGPLCRFLAGLYNERLQRLDHPDCLRGQPAIPPDALLVYLGVAAVVCTAGLR